MLASQIAIITKIFINKKCLLINCVVLNKNYQEKFIKI